MLKHLVECFFFSPVIFFLETNDWRILWFVDSVFMILFQLFSGIQNTHIYAMYYRGNAFLHSLSAILNWGKGLDLMHSPITWLCLCHFELWVLNRHIGTFPSLRQMEVTFSLSRTQFDLSLSFIYFNVFHFMSPNVFILTQLYGSAPKFTCYNHSSSHLYENQQWYFIPYSPKWAISARLVLVLFACQMPPNVLF